MYWAARPESIVKKVKDYIAELDIINHAIKAQQTSLEEALQGVKDAHPNAISVEVSHEYQKTPYNGKGYYLDFIIVTYTKGTITYGERGLKTKPKLKFNEQLNSEVIKLIMG